MNIIKLNSASSIDIVDFLDLTIKNESKYKRITE